MTWRKINPDASVDFCNIKTWLFRFSHVRAILLTGSVVLASCKEGNIISTKELKLGADFCVPGSVLTFNSFAVPPVNVDSFLSVSNSSRKAFSEVDILLANATGTLHLLGKAMTMNRDSSCNGKLQCVELKTRIHDQIESSYLQVEVFITELSCEVERLKQIAVYLDKKSKKIIRVRLLHPLLQAQPPP